MKTLFISSTAPGAGQTLLAWLLAETFLDRGLRVAVFRPMGVKDPKRKGDSAVNLLYEVLGNRLAGAPDVPVLVDPQGGVDPELADLYHKKIINAFNPLKKICDVCIALGSRDVFFDAEQTSPPDTRFIEMLDAETLLLDRFVTKAMTVYSTLALSSFLRERLAGIIVNRIPCEAFEAFSTQTLPMLKSKGAPILACLPEDIVIKSPTLSDIAELLDASVPTGEEHLSRLVTGKTISAPDLAPSLKILRRVVNKIMLQGGEVHSLACACDEILVGLILTCGREPAGMVLKAAKEAGLPILLTKLDTFEVIEKIDHQEWRLTARDGFKQERFKELLQAQASLKDLPALLGV